MPALMDPPDVGIGEEVFPTPQGATKGATSAASDVGIGEEVFPSAATPAGSLPKPLAPPGTYGSSATAPVPQGPFRPPPVPHDLLGDGSQRFSHVHVTEPPPPPPIYDIDQKTGQKVARVPYGALPVLDSTGAGVSQIAKGAAALGRQLAHPAVLPADAHVMQGQPGTPAQGSILDPGFKMPVPGPDEVARNAASDLIEGFFTTAQPIMVGGAITAPVLTAIGVAKALVGQYGAAQAVKKLGGDESAQRLVGNIVAAGSASITGRDILAEINRTARPLVLAGQLHGAGYGPGTIPGGNLGAYAEASGDAAPVGFQAESGGQPVAPTVEPGVPTTFASQPPGLDELGTVRNVPRADVPPGPQVVNSPAVGEPVAFTPVTDVLPAASDAELHALGYRPEEIAAIRGAPAPSTQPRHYTEQDIHALDHPPATAATEAAPAPAEPPAEPPRLSAMDQVRQDMLDPVRRAEAQAMQDRAAAARRLKDTLPRGGGAAAGPAGGEAAISRDETIPIKAAPTEEEASQVNAPVPSAAVLDKTAPRGAQPTNAPLADETPVNPQGAQKAPEPLDTPLGEEVPPAVVAQAQQAHEPTSDVASAAGVLEAAFVRHVDTQQLANPGHSRAQLDTHFAGRPVGDVGLTRGEREQIGRAIGVKDPEVLIRMTWDGFRQALREKANEAVSTPVQTVANNKPPSGAAVHYDVGERAVVDPDAGGGVWTITAIDGDQLHLAHNDGRTQVLSADQVQGKLAGKPPAAPQAPRKSPATPPAFGYFHGDKGAYTGKVEHLHGGTFYEIQLVEGHLKGQTKLITQAPAPSAGETATPFPVGARVTYQSTAFKKGGRNTPITRDAVVLGPSSQPGGRIRIKADGEGFERHVLPERLTLHGGVREPSQTPAGALPEDRPEERAPSAGAGAQSGRQRPVRGRARAERFTRAAADVERTGLDDLVAHAVSRGYDGDPAALRRELVDRLQLVHDLDAEFDTSGHNPEALLRAIAGYGGLSVGKESGLKGELKWLKEFRDQKPSASRKNLKAPPVVADTVRGIKGVFRDQALSVDGMLEALRQEPRFQYLETEQDLLDEIRAAATAEHPSLAIGRLTEGLGEQWWQTIGHTREVQPRLPEAGAVRDQEHPTPELDIPFSLSGEIDRAASASERDLFAEREPGDEDVDAAIIPEGPTARAAADKELATLGQTLRPVHGALEARQAAATFVQEPLTNLETGIVATVSRASLDKMLSKSNVVLSVSSQAHVLAVGNLDTLFRLSTLRESRPSKKDPTNIDAIHHFDVPMPFDGRVLRVKLLAKAFRREVSGTRLYLVEAVEVEAPGLVEEGQTSDRSPGRSSPSPPDASGDRFAEMAAIVKRGQQPPSGRTPIAQATLIPGAAQFLARDVTPALRAAFQDAGAAHASIRALWAPDTVSGPAETMATVMRPQLAVRRQRDNRARKAMRALEVQFDKMPQGTAKDQPTAGTQMAFAMAVDEGRIDALPAWQQPVARMLAEINTRKRNESNSLGGKVGYIKDYFPREWLQPGKVREFVMRALYGKRPLQGRASFKKARARDKETGDIYSFRHLLAAGFEPVAPNPITAHLRKWTEMDKWIAAKRILIEGKQLGVALFIKIGLKPPEGWRRYPESFGTVYGPPVVQVKEAYDAGLMDAIHTFAKAHGITLVRKVSMGGQKWGYVIKGKDTVYSRFGGPEGVLMHEIGHVLDHQYGLGEHIGLAQASERQEELNFSEVPSKVRRELRDLADLRADTTSTPGFRKYIRNRAEVIANLVHAFLYVPDKAKAVAPNAYWALYNLTKDTPDLHGLFDIQKARSLRFGVNSADVPVGGLVIKGYYYGPPDAVRLLENHLSPGLRGHLVFDLYRRAGNFLNQVQLGLSLFHVMTTAVNSTVSRGALGLEQLSRGHFAEAAKSLALAHTLVVPPLLDVILGDRLLKQFYAKDANFRGLVDAGDLIVRGGGGVGWDTFWHNSAPERFLQSFRGIGAEAKAGNYPGAALRTGATALRAFPAAVEQMAKPIMEQWVPRLKLAAFWRLAMLELRDLGPQPDPHEVDKVLQKAWESIDNRFGELVYDNLFWNGVLKDAGMASVRALGWNLGTVREVFGAIPAQAAQLGLIPGAGSGGGFGKPPMRLRNTGTQPDAAGGADIPVYQHGRAPWLSHQFAYLMALVFIAAEMGALYQKLHTGLNPGEQEDGSIDPSTALLDLYFPRTGGMTRDGRPDRATLWTYMKDVFAFIRHPITTVEGKVNPILSLTLELIRNEDYFGTAMRNPDDPLVQQLEDVVKYLATQYRPISAQSFLQRAQQRGGLTVGTAAESLLGVNVAPRSATRTALEDYLHEIQPPSHRSQADEARLEARRALRDAVQDKDDAARRQAIAGGLLTRRSMLSTLKAARFSALQLAFRSTTLDQAVHAYTLGTPEERLALKAELLMKRARLLPQVAPTSRQAMQIKVQAALALPAAARAALPANRAAPAP